ncbi:Alpha-1,2-mannosidase [Arcticibacter svalbardensis MN12-7]|uniref:Alpha-1,2-mannosidase n=1 Tax=Arcticibacter svalbardensis MN12-7 TaxID=1150600 RepID=R9GSE5_9SPHI|nr:glycoside hydrolase family 88 protein [Arcticibacter svalbardensis]EOR94608.1 Alpha-1,2-mannosidase [Arcticibacter svalbardensis MN12-7]
MIKIKTILFCILGATILNSCKTSQPLNNKEALDYSVAQVRRSAESLTQADSIPRNIPDGQKTWKKVGPLDWTSGFWPGVLWYAYEYTGDSFYKQQAEKFTAPIAIIAKIKAQDHDIGFQIYCSFGNGLRLTSYPEYKKILLAAADTLATLYNPKVGTILSWPSQVSKFKHSTIMDNMMNLELLFWAAKNGGSQKLYDIAVSHATQSLKHLVRPDGSTYHVASFDPETGAYIKSITHQGYADESMWARGQTWGIYGFSIAYRETGKEEFLNTAIKISDRFIEKLPKDGIPYWDFDDPAIPNAPKDASAAAIAACGLLELSDLVKTEALNEKYKNAAIALIRKLSTDEYLAKDKNLAILLHSTGHKPKGTEIDVPIIYADYYYLEALLKIKKLEEKSK